MKNFKITINYESQVLTGEFAGETEEQAIETCKDFYAHALNTWAEHIEIDEIKPVK